MDNINLKSVNFLGIIFHYKLTFEEHTQDKVNNAQHIISS